MNPILGGMITQFVRFAVGYAAFNSAPASHIEKARMW